MQYRATRAVRDHPWLSLGGITAFAGLWPIILPLVGLLVGFIDTPTAAKEREAALETKLNTKIDSQSAVNDKHVAELFAEIAKIHAELNEMRASNARQSAGLTTQLLQTSTIVARNRVNDCNIMKQQKGTKITTLELTACFQYEQDYEDARRRFDQAQTNAVTTWRTQ